MPWHTHHQQILVDGHNDNGKLPAIVVLIDIPTIGDEYSIVFPLPKANSTSTAWLNSKEGPAQAFTNNPLATLNDFDIRSNPGFGTSRGGAVQRHATALVILHDWSPRLRDPGSPFGSTTPTAMPHRRRNQGGSPFYSKCTKLRSSKAIITQNNKNTECIQMCSICFYCISI